MPITPVSVETNAGTILTSSVGVGTYIPRGPKAIVGAVVHVAGYVAVVTSTTQGAITFQLYEQAGSVAGAFAPPTGTVTIAPGSLQAVIFGE
jgi:hypothetical protein